MPLVQPPVSESATVSPDRLDVLRDLGDAKAELEAAGKGLFYSRLSQFAMLEISGADASTFLQGQLSCDVEALRNSDRCSLGAYCTAKGRILASFLLWEHSGLWNMMLPRSLATPIQKRLSMFVLRSKVQIRAAEEFVLTGIAGPLPPEIGTVLSDEAWIRINHDTRTVVTLPGKRSLICCTEPEGSGIQGRLTGEMLQTGTAAWDWTEVRNGIPWITPATQDQFVPQMVNLELIGGVSFKKGCYPGQEIVARTQYLGKVKRRMFLAHVSSVATAGQSIHSDDVGGQINGMVVNAETAPSGGTDLLVSVQTESASNSRVHLGSPDGPVLEFLPLPYSIS